MNKFIYPDSFQLEGVTMKKFGLAASFMVAVALVAASPAMAQEKKKARQRVSPHETIEKTIDGDDVKLVYGRPYAKKPGTEEVRKIWGGLVPYDKVWRTGADEATLLTTTKSIVMGDLTLAPGTYSLFTIPAADGSAKLIVNKRTGQWGVPYDEAKEKDNELARIDLKKEELDKNVDQFTMAVEKGSSAGGVIKMSWEKIGYSMPFTVKD
jgi:hypothetical protein